MQSFWETYYEHALFFLYKNNKSKKTKELIQSVDCRLIFLPWAGAVFEHAQWFSSSMSRGKVLEMVSWRVISLLKTWPVTWQWYKIQRKREVEWGVREVEWVVPIELCYLFVSWNTNSAIKETLVKRDDVAPKHCKNPKQQFLSKVYSV